MEKTKIKSFNNFPEDVERTLKMLEAYYMKSGTEIICDLINMSFNKERAKILEFINKKRG